jgi:hypothetical protein
MRFSLQHSFMFFCEVARGMSSPSGPQAHRNRAVKSPPNHQGAGIAQMRVSANDVRVAV